jgi:Mg-chelatase subunit ChlD
MKPIDPTDPFDRPGSVQVVAAPERGVSLGVVAALIGGGAGLLGAGVLLGVYVTSAVARAVPPIAREVPTPVIETRVTAPIPSGPVRGDRRRIEVAFVMDTTGSMSGMLRAARQKAWSIVDALADLEPRPEVKVGLVAFRDHGDDYVTRATPLTTDVDAFYQALHGLKAIGGGGKPEAIDEALRVAVRDLGWTAPGDERTSRLIVVIGDAPPHAAQPGVAEALAAHAAGITVSTLQIGDDPEATDAFLRLAKAGGGGAMTVQPSAQGRLAQQVVTPLDAEVAALQRRIEATVVPYGSAAQQGAVLSQQALNSSLGQEEYSARASALCKTRGFYEADLLDALDSGRLAPADVRRELLGAEHAQAWDRGALDALRQERAAARAELAQVVAKRDAWLRTNGAREGLDARLLDCIKQHAASAR